jgi:hypothetical protein
MLTHPQQASPAEPELGTAQPQLVWNYFAFYDFSFGSSEECAPAVGVTHIGDKPSGYYWSERSACAACPAL